MRVMHGDWRDLFHVFRIALDPRKLSLCMVGVTLTGIVWGGVVGLFVWIDDRAGGGEAPPLVASLRAHWAATDQVGQARHLAAARERVSEYFDDTFHRPVARGVTRRSFLAAKTRQVIEPVVGAARVRRAVEALVPCRRQGWLLWIACLSSGWYIWSIFGGAVARIAAVQIAKDEPMEFAEAWVYAGQNWRHAFWSPMIVAFGILGFGLANFAAGYWCGHHRELAPWVLGAGLLAAAVIASRGGVRAGFVAAVAAAAIAGAGYAVPRLGEMALLAGLPLALLSGLLMLLLGIGLALGWPLMLPAIAAEGTDSFDAVARSFSYVYQHPWRYAGYHLVGLVYAIPCATFVLACACAMVHLALGTGGAGMDMGLSDASARWAPIHGTVSYIFSGLGIPTHGDLPAGAVARAAGYCVSVLLLVVWGLSVSFIPAFVLTAHTMMYFLLRRVTDGTEMKEVFEEEPEEEWAPPPPPEGAAPGGAAPAGGGAVGGAG